MADSPRQKPRLVGALESKPPWMCGTKLGAYTLVAQIAKGGMAEIWLARQTGPQGFERVMVVKRILTTTPDDDKAALGMFLDEARIAAHLSHPNIVHVFELQEDQGDYFIAMEYLHGENVWLVMRQGFKVGKVLSVPLAVRIVASAAEGLAHAHTRKDHDGKPLGIVHRDVSPHNLVVTYDGVVKVVDFGIAKARNRSSQTGQGLVKGKLAYMSPEQALGEPVDPQSDVFSLGVVLFEAATRTRFHQDRDDRAICVALASDKPFPSARERNPEIPVELDQIIARALARDKNQRFASARFFQVALEGWLRKQPVTPGSFELETYMRSIFAARLEERARLLDFARSGAESIDLDGLSESTPGKTPESGFERAMRYARRLALGKFTLKAALAIGGVALGYLLVVGPPTGATHGSPAAPAVARPASVAVARPSPVALEAQPVAAALALVEAGPAVVAGPAPVARAPVLVEAGPAVVAGQAPVAAARPAEGKSQRPASPVQLGRVAIDASPWVKVFLGTRLLGETPLLGVSLPAGKQTLRVVNEEAGIDQRVEVEVKPGQLTTRRLKF